MAKLTGTCIRWTDRGYGFIQPDIGGADFFVHVSEIVSGADQLIEGQRVEFDEASDQKTGRPCAKNVRVLS